MILIFEKYTENMIKVRQMAQFLGIDLVVFCLKDNGFLPDWALTPYKLFSPAQPSCPPVEKGLFLNFLKVPELWEIRLDSRSQGAIYDMGRKKATISFSEPQENKNIAYIKWRMESGWVYKIDFYNRYGVHYASQFLDKEGSIESQVFYSFNQKELIVSQPQNDVVSLFDNGKLKAYFTSYSQFIAYCIEKTGLAKSCAIFVQEEKQLSFISHMLQEQVTWKYALFEKPDLLQKYQDSGMKNGYLFHTIPNSYPTNHANTEALILTASDQIEGIEAISFALPEMTFHIAANTQVSEILIRLSEQRKNIKIYPQISQEALNALWDTCDFYLDINHYREIYNAIDTAHQKNLLILGFENTLHHKELVIDECVFAVSKYDDLSMAIRQNLNNPALMQHLLKKQQNNIRNMWKNEIFYH